MKQLTYDKYGCRVIQKLLEKVPQNLHDIILKDVKGIVLETLHDEFGNHVVQRIIFNSPQWAQKSDEACTPYTER